MNTDELLLFLYRDVGLYWEKELSLPKKQDRITKQAHANFKRYINSNDVTLNFVTSQNIIQKITLNTFYMTKSSPSILGSFLKHLRNSIMHGNYEIKNHHSKTELIFKDYYQDMITMAGSISVDMLVQLMDCIR
jgi:hypothetical protein